MRINKRNEFTIITAKKSSLVFVFVLYLQSQRCKHLEKIEFILESFFLIVSFFLVLCHKTPQINIQGDRLAAWAAGHCFCPGSVARASPAIQGCVCQGSFVWCHLAAVLWSGRMEAWQKCLAEARWFSVRMPQLLWKLHFVVTLNFLRFCLLPRFSFLSVAPWSITYTF